MDTRKDSFLWKWFTFKLMQDDLSLEEIPELLRSPISTFREQINTYLIGMNDIVTYKFHTEEYGFYWHECELCNVCIMPFNSDNGLNSHALSESHINAYFRKYNVSKPAGITKEKEKMLALIREGELNREKDPRICYDFKDIPIHIGVSEYLRYIYDTPAVFEQWLVIMRKESKSTYERKRATNSLTYTNVRSFIEMHEINEFDKRQVRKKYEERRRNGIVENDFDYDDRIEVHPNLYSPCNCIKYFSRYF